jgi:hypothetical protein
VEPKKPAQGRLAHDSCERNIDMLNLERIEDARWDEGQRRTSILSMKVQLEERKH